MVLGRGVMKLVNLKNPVMASWMRAQGARLDAPPFLSGAIEARKLLEQLSVKKDPLKQLTLGGEEGIFHAGRIKRHWVTEPKYGISFLSSTDILQADLSHLALISKRAVTENPKLTIHKDWSLITRSGSIGRMAYARPDMDSMACTEDVLRVVPDPNRILPGYLYAFLSSKFGLPLVVGGTYGAIIQHIEPHHIANLPVPRLGEELEASVHELVQEAAELRTRASHDLNIAVSAVGSELQAPSSQANSAIESEQHSTVVYASELRSTWRLDGFYYNPIAQTVESWARNHQNGYTNLGRLCKVFDVPQFKHIYVEEGQGLPFFTSGELFLLERKAQKFLSKTQTKGLEKYILQKGWILLARSGQLGGIIGRPQFSDSALHKATTSDHVIRIASRDSIPPGYLFAYLANNEIGYPLLTRTMTGASIPALWPQDLEKVPIVLAVPEFMEGIDFSVQNAFELRVRSSFLETDAHTLIESAIEEAS